jgi:hypothetical protein
MMFKPPLMIILRMPVFYKFKLISDKNVSCKYKY